MRITLFFLIMTCLVIAKPFQVATYNVQNLFDAITDGTEYDEYTQSAGWNTKLFQTKLNHIAEVICDINAEVIALQEVEHKKVFQQLQQRLKEVGCGYKYGVITDKKGSPIEVALLSQFRIANTKSHTVVGKRSRDILQVSLSIEGVPLEIFVNHWKAKSHQGYESKRHRYAKALRKALQQLPKEREYILLGDFNTNYDLYPLSRSIDDTYGVIGLHHYLELLHQGSFVTQKQLYKPTSKHMSLWSELPPKERWSMKVYGYKVSPDHIILPSLLFDNKGISYTDNSFRVFKRPYLFTKKGYINATYITQGKLKGYSDHLPLVATFDTQPFKAKRSLVPHAREPKTFTIAELYEEKPKSTVVLKDVAVVLKYKNHAVVKQKNGRGIFMYGSAKTLQQGELYDLVVDEITSYKGLLEITQARPLQHKGSFSEDSGYYTKPTQLRYQLRQNEVLKDVQGYYENGKLTIGRVTLPLYIKPKGLTLQDGVTLKIDYVHIGYYKRLQFVLYSQKDFQIVEGK